MTKTKKLGVFTLAGILVVLVGSWFLLISPQRAEASRIHDQTLAEREQVSALTGELRRLKAEAKDLPKQQAVLASITKKIPDNPELPTLIRQLKSQADKADVEMVSLKPSPPAPPAGAATSTTLNGEKPAAGSAGTLESIPVALEMSGGFYQMEAFVLSLEQLERSFVVRDFQITYNSEPGTAGSGVAKIGKGPLTVTINGEVFVAEGASTAPASTTAASAPSAK